jgi:hypothetical protein
VARLTFGRAGYSLPRRRTATERYYIMRKMAPSREGFDASERLPEAGRPRCLGRQVPAGRCFGNPILACGARPTLDGRFGQLI